MTDADATAASEAPPADGPDRPAGAGLGRRRRWRRWLSILAALGALAMLAGPWVRMWYVRTVPRRWGTVVSGRIYRSGQLTRWLVEDTLRDHEIRVVVSLSGYDPNDEHMFAQRQACDRLGITRHNFPLAGNGTGDIRAYAGAIAVLADCDRRGERVLVHCWAGTQRTGGVVACYRVLVQGRPPAEAMAEMRRYGFTGDADGALLKYLNRHMAELARLLVDKGVIDRVPDPLPRLE